MKTLLILLVIGGISMTACKTTRKRTAFIRSGHQLYLSEGGFTHRKLDGLMQNHPGYFKDIVNNPANRVQVIWSVIRRDRDNRAHFTDYYFHVDTNAYFYPASTVKLPVAALALQKLHELNIPGVDMNTTMITESDYIGQSPVYNDPSSPDGRPTIANYVKKILLVSDNDAFNRLYEFLGQEYINRTLHLMGYTQTRIIHRLDIRLTDDQNRHTNPVSFYDTKGKLLYRQPGRNSGLTYDGRQILMGKGFIRDGKLVNEPFDFTLKNRLTLPDLHQVLRSILFPEAVAEHQRFHLDENDYGLLRKYMSMYPSETSFPAYEQGRYWDTYGKFLYYGSEKWTPEKNIRIFNKVGDAYGFLIDAAYVADFGNNTEFILTAMILCNKDEVFNDDRYEYEEVGLPFLKHLGEVIHDYSTHDRSGRGRIPPTFSFEYR